MQPTGEFQPAQPVVERRGSSRGLVLVVVFLALCTLVFAGLYCYEKFIAKDDNVAIADTEPKEKCETAAESEKVDGVEKSEILGVATADTDLQVRKLVKDIKEAVVEGFKATLGGWDGYSTVYPITTLNEEGGAFVLKEGVQTRTEKAYGVLIQDYPDATKNLATKEGVTKMLEKTFEKYGMKDKTGKEHKATYFGEDPVYFEGDDGLFCSFLASDDLTEITCSHKDWISKEKIALVNALLKAANDDNVELDYLDANVEDIEDGANGAQRIVANVNDAVALFYRKDSGSDWKYFRMVQNALGCSEFDTDELKDAFNGELCYDGDAQSTVK